MIAIQLRGWCVCSPTRAMLLTGRHPIRVGSGPETGGELNPKETTIAEGLKANGYRTVDNTGAVSWWHNREFRPGDTGYTDDLLTEHAIDFIRANKAQPFFWSQFIAAKAAGSAMAYVAMFDEVDEATADSRDWHDGAV